MDFILEMYAKDHPNDFKFNRANSDAPIEATNTQWANVLTGKALAEFIASRMPVLPARYRGKDKANPRG